MNERAKLGPLAAGRTARMAAQLLGFKAPASITDEDITAAVNVALRICAEVDKHVAEEYRWRSADAFPARAMR